MISRWPRGTLKTEDDRTLGGGAFLTFDLGRRVRNCTGTSSYAKSNRDGEQPI